MKTLTLKSNLAFVCRIFLLAGLILLVCLGRSWGQVYADTVRSGTTTGVGSSSVVNSGNTINVSLTDSSRLTATSTLGTLTAWIQLIFKNKTLPANTLAFIKYKSTGSLLGGDVIGVAYSGSTGSGTIGTPQTSFSQDVMSADGTKFLAVTTSSSSFNSARLTLSSPIALGTNTADVFYGAYYTSLSCGIPLFTGVSATGINIGSIQNPTQAIDGNITTYSNFNVALAAAGTMTQSIYYDSLGSSIQDATITISAPAGALLNLNLLGSITIQAFNGNTSVGSPVVLSSLLTLNLLNLAGSDKPFNVSIAPGGAFNRIDVTNSSALNLLSGFRIYEVAITPNMPQFTLPANDTVFVCKGSSVNLTADNPGTGNELRWYASFLATDTAVLDTGSYTPPFVINTDTVFYVAAGKIGCTPSSQRVPVRVLIKPIPIKPTATDPSICSGTSTTLTVTSPIAGNTYTWYKTSTGGTSLGSTTYTTSILTADTTVYLQADSANGCSSKRDTVIVTIKPLPIKPTAVDPAICTGTSTILSVTSPIAGNTYNWFKVSTGGTAIATGTTYTTSVLTADTTIYLQADSANGCSSKRDTVIVTIKPLPIKPGAPDLSICSGTITTLTVTSPIAGNTYTWYKVGTGGTAIATGTSYTTSVLTADTTIYLQADSVGCSSKRDTVVVTIKPLPAKPGAVDPSICSGTSTTLTVTSPIAGNTYTWYKTSTGGTSIATGTSYTTSVLAADTTVYLQADSANGCSSKRDTVIVTIKLLPIKPTAADPSICSGTSTTLTITAPIVGNTYTWYKTGTGGTSIHTGTSYTTSVLTADTTLYVQSDSTNGCSNSTRDTVIVTIKPLPAKPTALDSIICSGTSIILAVVNPVGGNTYNWFKTSTGGSTIHTGTTYTTSALIADTILYVQADSANGCSGKRDTVTITVNPIPSIQFTTPINVCDGITVTSIAYINAQNTPAYYHFAWSAGAITSGFSNDTTDISIINPIPILIPNTANPAAYSGNLIIKNAINGHQCASTYPFLLNLVALPAALMKTTFE